MVLVTGGTGLVGVHLLYQLSQESDKIVAIHRKASDLGAVRRIFGYYTKDPDTVFSKITWKEADITDISSLQEVFKDHFKHVYHCAALISFNSRDYYELRNVNIQGTANMINISLQKSIEKFCFVSSIATLDELHNKQFITEENEWNPQLKHHGYAITKYGAEMEVWRGSQEGLDVVIVNPGVILGAGLWHSGSGKLFSSVASGFKYYAEGITGFVSVKDVVNCMIQLMQSQAKNERFVLVSENISFKMVLFMIADKLNVKRPYVRVTKFMSEFAWRLDWLKNLFGGKRKFTKHTARSGHHICHYSSEKIKKRLNIGFEPVKDTIAKVCEIYKKDTGFTL